MAASTVHKKRDEIHDPKGVHWQYGFSSVNYESEAFNKFHGEARKRIVTDACRTPVDADAAHKAAELRKSNVSLGAKCTSGPSRARSETQLSYVPMPYCAHGSCRELSKDLRKSHIDFAAGQDKSCKEWKAAQEAALSSNSDEKFGCSRPEGFEQMAKELRKSNIPIPLREAGIFLSGRTEQRDRFSGRSLPPSASYADTLGKDLRKSHLDIANGHPTHPRHWQSQASAEMASASDKKWACKKPEGLDHLLVELRKSNVNFGGDKVDYSSTNQPGVTNVRR